MASLFAGAFLIPMQLTIANVFYSLDNLPDHLLDNVPSYLQFGACALATQRHDLTHSMADEMVFVRGRQAFIRQLHKDEDARLQWDAPARTEKLMDDYRQCFEVTVNYVIDYHRGNNAKGGRFLINDPGRGEITTMSADKVALYLSQFNELVMPAHVREARRRLHQPRDSHVRTS